MRSSRLLLLAPIAAVAIAGCGLGDDGPRVVQARDVAAFTRVVDRGAVDVRLHAGARQRVRVRAGQDVIGDVRTEVRDGTLDVSFEHHGFGGDAVVVEAWLPKLTGVEASGSGDVEGDSLDSSALEVRSDGSGDIALEGAARQLTVDLNGSGDADLAGVEAREARVRLSGSGDADVRAAERLDARVDGSGDIRYHGDPAVSQQLDGSGGIDRAD
jgi:hypothetical protein